MEKCFIISVVFLSSVFYLVMFKNTIIGFSFKKSNYIGVGFALEVFCFIFPGIVLITLFGPEHFWALFKIKSTESNLASIILLIQIAFLFVALFILSNTIFKRFVVFSVNPITEEKLRHINLLTNAVIFSLLVCNTVVFLVFGYKHAIFAALFSGDSLSLLRYDNVDSHMPTFLVYFFFVNSYLLASLAVFHNKSKKILYFILALYFCSLSGQKMPVVNVVLIFLFSSLMIAKSKLNYSLVIKMLVFPLVILVFLFYFVRLQYHNYDLKLFVDYFYNRVGVGFVAGYYEQFALRLQDINYIWHSIPFANQFQVNPNFHKDLMMISENRIDPNNIGIKNTFFLAEAYAIGGVFLFVISPVIYAFNYLLSLSILIYFAKKFALLSIDISQFCMGFVFIFFINMTGGFSDILFFKSSILIAIFVTVPFLIAFVWNKFSRGL